jgi:hypothetical protein
VTDLTDRMRTCAAFILRGEDHKYAQVYSDAADLLIEASNALEAIPEPLGEPMEILPETKVVAKPSDLPVTGVPRKIASAADMMKGVWTTNAGDLPPVPTGPPSKRPVRVCPQCDSRATKKVYREGSRLMLACPVCGAGWEYKL